MKENENIYTKRAKQKIGRVTLYMAAYIISVGATILCANSKYENARASFITLETIEPTVIDVNEGTIVAVPEGYSYNSETDKGEKLVFNKEVEALAAQQRQDDIIDGSTASALGAMFLATAPLGKRQDLRGKKIPEDEENKRVK